MLIREPLDVASSLRLTPTGLQPCFTDVAGSRRLFGENAVG
jgi:hypothetical protein